MYDEDLSLAICSQFKLYGLSVKTEQSLSGIILRFRVYRGRFELGYIIINFDNLTYRVSVYNSGDYNIIEKPLDIFDTNNTIKLFTLPIV